MTQLLIRRRNIRSAKYQRPLTEELILRWADAHQRRTGKYPGVESGRVVGAKGESWALIRASLAMGSRGLPGGDSLTLLLARHGRVEYRRSWIRGLHLSTKQIKAWAVAHRKRTGKWPNVNSGPVVGAKGENWKDLDRSLRQGNRGLPGGISLAVLTGRRNAIERRVHRSPLKTSRILAWADAHHARTGAWPLRTSGPVVEEPTETWSGIHTALLGGFRGLGTTITLAAFLAKERGASYRRPNQSPLTYEKVLKWADAHFRRTGTWPRQGSGAVTDAPGETWKQIAAMMSTGGRGLIAGWTLSQLLHEERGVRMRNAPPPLSVRQILKWADAHYKRHGKWPNHKNGAVEDAPGESWGAIDQSLTHGARGLSPGQTLALFLMEHRNKVVSAYKPKLTKALILEWAEAHHRRTGKWPSPTGGPIPESPGDTWKTVAGAMYKGSRGMPRGQSLMQLLSLHHGSVSLMVKPKLTEEKILLWARAHARRTGEWPTLHSGKVDDAEFENWSNINDAMRRSQRGLTCGITLGRFLSRHRLPKRKTEWRGGMLVAGRSKYV